MDFCWAERGTMNPHLRVHYHLGVSSLQDELLGYSSQKRSHTRRQTKTRNCPQTPRTRKSIGVEGDGETGGAVGPGGDPGGDRSRTAHAGPGRAGAGKAVGEQRSRWQRSEQQARGPGRGKGLGPARLGNVGGAGEEAGVGVALVLQLFSGLTLARCTGHGAAAVAVAESRRSPSRTDSVRALPAGLLPAVPWEGPHLL